MALDSFELTQLKGLSLLLVSESGGPIWVRALASAALCIAVHRRQLAEAQTETARFEAAQAIDRDERQLLSAALELALHQLALADLVEKVVRR